ncbi:MAG: hypothetical protein RLZZ232_1039 [Planctomycetota bacterium]|jgi:hypothetical protein
MRGNTAYSVPIHFPKNQAHFLKRNDAFFHGIHREILVQGVQIPPLLLRTIPRNLPKNRLRGLQLEPMVARFAIHDV